MQANQGMLVLVPGECQVQECQFFFTEFPGVGIRQVCVQQDYDPAIAEYGFARADFPRRQNFMHQCRFIMVARDAEYRT